MCCSNKYFPTVYNVPLFQLGWGGLISYHINYFLELGIKTNLEYFTLLRIARQNHIRIFLMKFHRFDIIEHGQQMGLDCVRV